MCVARLAREDFKKSQLRIYNFVLKSLMQQQQIHMYYTYMHENANKCDKIWALTRLGRSCHNKKIGPSK